MMIHYFHDMALRILAWLSAITLACTVFMNSAVASSGWATLDWTLAETLIALDAPLSGVAQTDAYHAWVGEPQIPESVVDLGLRAQPNLELLADLSPDTIFISPMFHRLTSRLERIAPVETFSLYQADSDTWQAMQHLTRTLGERVGRQQEAENLITDTATLLRSLQSRLSAPAPLLIVQFMDDRHVRVFGKNGLYDAVLEQLGIANAWQEATNAWGFSLVGIETLIDYPEAQLVVIEPLPVGVQAALEDSGLWQHLPSVQNGHAITLPPVWSFGGLPSAQRFARSLATALEASHDR